MKRWIALLATLCLLLSITALAEETDLEGAERFTVLDCSLEEPDGT